MATKFSFPMFRSNVAVKVRTRSGFKPAMRAQKLFSLVQLFMAIQGLGRGERFWTQITLERALSRMSQCMKLVVLVFLETLATNLALPRRNSVFFDHVPRKGLNFGKSQTITRVLIGITNIAHARDLGLFSMDFLDMTIQVGLGGKLFLALLATPHPFIHTLEGVKVACHMKSFFFGILGNKSFQPLSTARKSFRP